MILTYSYFLGLKTLTVIRDAVENIKKSKGIEVDIDNIDLDDSKIYEMISSGDCGGIFQLESSGIIQFMRDLQPKSLEDIIAGISLYRPGPMDQIPTYIENKKHPDKIKYLHPLLEPILEVTYGCIVYQEQVMQIFRDLAGFSMGRSDIIRRAMSKKKLDVMESEGEIFFYGKKDEEGNQIIDGCLNRGVPLETAQSIWNEIREFAKYAFNKSHAAAYAVLGAQTAWLKAYYPAEFYAALLSSVMGNDTRTSRYIEECRQRGIEVVAPDVNNSFYKYTVKDDNIVFGLGSIKNVGANFIDEIVKERELNGDYTSLTNFCERVESLNKRALQSLIKGGAFDFTGLDRGKLLAMETEAVSRGQEMRKIKLSGQNSFFTNPDVNLSGLEAPLEAEDIEPLKPELKLLYEKDVLGVYLSGHPLKRYERLIENELPYTLGITQSYEDLTKAVPDQSHVSFAGLITGIKTQLTKNKDLMAFAKLEDQYGSLELTIFPNVYDKKREYLIEDLPVIASGKICYDEELNVSIVLDDLEPLHEKEKKLHEFLTNEENFKNLDYSNGVLTLYLDDLSKQKYIPELKNILKTTPGKVPVILYFNKERKRFKASNALNVEMTDNLAKRLNAFLEQINRR